jgi:peroxiredoxin Q/BCP
MGTARRTFLIDPEGRIARVWEKVKPEGHAADVLAALDELQADAA